MDKRGQENLNKVIIEVVIVAIILSLFLYATSDKITGRGIKQQVVEKQLALLIDSAIPGMEFKVNKQNPHGVIQNIQLRDGRVFVFIDGFSSFRGYPYFSQYKVSLENLEDHFLIKVYG